MSLLKRGQALLASDARRKREEQQAARDSELAAIRYHKERRDKWVKEHLYDPDQPVVDYTKSVSGLAAMVAIKVKGELVAELSFHTDYAQDRDGDGNPIPGRDFDTIHVKYHTPPTTCWSILDEDELAVALAQAAAGAKRRKKKE